MSNSPNKLTIEILKTIINENELYKFELVQNNYNNKINKRFLITYDPNLLTELKQQNIDFLIYLHNKDINIFDHLIIHIFKHIQSKHPKNTLFYKSLRNKIKNFLKINLDLKLNKSELLRIDHLIENIKLGNICSFNYKNFRNKDNKTIEIENYWNKWKNDNNKNKKYFLFRFLNDSYKQNYYKTKRKKINNLHYSDIYLSTTLSIDIDLFSTYKYLIIYNIDENILEKKPFYFTLFFGTEIYLPDIPFKIQNISKNDNTNFILNKGKSTHNKTQLEEIYYCTIMENYKNIPNYVNHNLSNKPKNLSNKPTNLSNKPITYNNSLDINNLLDNFKNIENDNIIKFHYDIINYLTNDFHNIKNYMYEKINNKFFNSNNTKRKIKEIIINFTEKIGDCDNITILKQFIEYFFEKKIHFKNENNLNIKYLKINIILKHEKLLLTYYFINLIINLILNNLIINENKEKLLQLLNIIQSYYIHNNYLNLYLLQYITNIIETKKKNKSTTINIFKKYLINYIDNKISISRIINDDYLYKNYISLIENLKIIIPNKKTILNKKQKLINITKKSKNNENQEFGGSFINKYVFFKNGTKRLIRNGKKGGKYYIYNHKKIYINK